MSSDLTGQSAVVVGSGGRLGPIWMAALRDAGATVTGVDLKDAEVRVDMRSVADLQSLAARWGLTPPQILVLNAGVDDRPTAEVAAMPRHALGRAMTDTNLLGTYGALVELGGALARHGRGSIITVASLYGVVVPDMRYYGDSGFRKHALYGATKAGIINLTKYFAALWAPCGVRVNAIAPGGVVDPTDPLTGQDAGFRARYTARIPMGRMCEPADLAGPLLFLASDASRFVTGHTLVLDGGYTCW